MKRFVAIFIAVISAFGMFAFSACSSDPDATDPDNTDPVTETTVDAAGWVAAMTSSDIYNSTATGTQTDYYTNSGGETTTNQYRNMTFEVDVAETNGNFTGKIYSLDIDDGESKTCYYLYDESGIRHYSYDTTMEDGYETCYYSDSLSVPVSSVLGNWYIQFAFSDESYFGGDYFNYSEEDGAYVWEFTSGGSESKYVIKIDDGNVVYCGKFSTYIYDTYTYTSAVEVYYTYGGVSVIIPEDIQSKFDALTVE